MIYVALYVFVFDSLTTIMKISKSAGPLLRPHVPLLVVPLLESITTLEPQVINYYSLHATSNQEVQEKVGSADHSYSIEYIFMIYKIIWSCNMQDIC